MVMVTKNAGEVIEEALKSVAGVWDELVVVDSGSTDGTVEVARKFTDKVYTFPFRDDFSKLRNLTLSKVHGDWVLVLDADERLSDEAIRQIPKLINNKDIDGFWFRRKTFITPAQYLRYGLFYPDYQLRLFRNKKEYRYRGAVHEQLAIPKEKTREVPYDILHYPQRPKYDRFSSFGNMAPYIRIHSGELDKSPKGMLTLFFEGGGKFLGLFFSGFLRGKGFLDGWAGFRAHFMFAASIAIAHGWAGWKKLQKGL